MGAVKTASQIKEHPILFSGEMVRAILAGNKSQTRRVVKPQPVFDGLWWSWKRNQKDWFSGVTEEQMKADYGLPMNCPYGKVGDHLWVREAAAYAVPTAVIYRADLNEVEASYWKFKSPIFLPRWASRLTLEITNIRVERLQEITTRDIEAEGVLPDAHYLGAANRLRHPFEEGWDKLNARRGYSWSVNPFVWVISFERISQ